MERGKLYRWCVVFELLHFTSEGLPRSAIFVSVEVLSGLHCPVTWTVLSQFHAFAMFPEPHLLRIEAPWTCLSHLICSMVVVDVLNHPEVCYVSFLMSSAPASFIESADHLDRLLIEALSFDSTITTAHLCDRSLHHAGEISSGVPH